jgi:hypothetical protein
MRTIRAEALAMKDRAKVQRVGTLAKNALFLEYVRRWEPDQAAGEGTTDLKRRLDSLQDENDVLTLECNDYHDQHNEQQGGGGDLAPRLPGAAFASAVHW